MLFVIPIVLFFSSPTCVLTGFLFILNLWIELNSKGTLYENIIYLGKVSSWFLIGCLCQWEINLLSIKSGWYMRLFGNMVTQATLSLSPDPVLLLGCHSLNCSTSLSFFASNWVAPVGAAWSWFCRCLWRCSSASGLFLACSWSVTQGHPGLFSFCFLDILPSSIFSPHASPVKVEFAQSLCQIGRSECLLSPDQWQLVLPAEIVWVVFSWGFLKGCDNGQHFHRVKVGLHITLTTLILMYDAVPVIMFIQVPNWGVCH